MIAESVFDRIAIKAITDFTGVVQFRGAGEMGGAAWTCSQVTALVTSLVATHVYLSSKEASTETISKSFVWTIVGGLSIGFVLSFASSFVLMKKSYRSTFFSTQTGCQYVQSKFLREGDENKKAVFK
jgi:hypothetical protein